MNQPQSTPFSTTAAGATQSTEWTALAAKMKPALAYVLRSNGVHDFLKMDEEALAQMALGLLGALELRDDLTGVQQPYSGDSFAKMLKNMGWEHKGGKEWNVISATETEVTNDVPSESTHPVTGDLPLLAPCPHCGLRLTYDEPGVFRPSGTGWKDRGNGIRSYHSFREVPREQWCYEVNCDTTIGGCGASISGDSKIEAVTAWNRRPVQMPVAVEQSPLRECSANGSSSCRYGPWGPKGQMQCEWCGEMPPQFDVAKQTDPAPLASEAPTVNVMQDTVGFTADELQLPYTRWVALVKERRKHLSPEGRRWLGDWTIWDLACSPMSDDERPQVRYGHYLGWWDRWHTEKTDVPIVQSSAIKTNLPGTT